ncbi:signal transduction protein [Saccharibacillus sp. VR-M41]|uniref:Signal transduction protein n=2 Tax=Saccharibacillus alkalitolerans TaxID=2705290 RepID=A0ABX0F907_9BACL|nr:signal transduction protein [Saccharibacillus alkalitolerans]
MQQELMEAGRGLDILGWNASVNDMHDRLMKRAVDLCEHEMGEAGYGPPPVSYAFVVFGSAGRREQTLWSDQDNGLVLSDDEHEDKETYFAEFGRRLTDILEAAGYEKCEGKVMCSEPRWRRTSSQWAAQLREWRSDLSWEPVRYLIIASDFRLIAGSEALAEAWQRNFYDGLRGNTELHAAILRNTVRHKKTLNVLGQVVTERFGDHAGDFDVKYGLYIPLVNAARFMALQHDVEETSTLRRLERLIQFEAASLPMLEPVHEAFLTALRLRNITETTERDGLLQSGGYLPNEQLKKKEQFYELRDSLVLVRKLHRVLQRQLRFAERRRA